MTPLRKKMLETIRMRGFSARTEQSYVQSMVELSRYFARCPSTLDERDLERFFKSLVLERGLAPASVRLHYNGIRFFYLNVLEWPSFAVPVSLPNIPQRIPELLTRAEVAQIVAQCANRKHRTLLTVCYGCGLRVSELVALRVSDVDGERSVLRITQGKGAKDRIVLMSAGVLEALRAYWRSYRPTVYLFPGRDPEVALAVTTAQKVFTRAKRAAGIGKVGGIHALRHAYATHQLDGGLPVHVLQRQLGHRAIGSTMRYVHWVPSYRDAGARHCDLAGALEAAS